jgi:hypothetical protein
LAYNFIASLSYDTAATYINVKECGEIQRPVINAILLKMGVNRDTSRIVVLVTCKYGGLGLYHLAMVQVLVQLQYIIRILRTQGTMGDPYQMLLEYTRLECGNATPISEAELSWYKQTILTKNWIMEFWRYLSLCKSMVNISGLWTPTKGRERATALVDEFTSQGMMDKRMSAYAAYTCKSFTHHTSRIWQERPHKTGQNKRKNK